MYMIWKSCFTGALAKIQEEREKKRERDEKERKEREEEERKKREEEEQKRVDERARLEEQEEQRKLTDAGWIDEKKVLLYTCARKLSITVFSQGVQ